MGLLTTAAASLASLLSPSMSTLGLDDALGKKPTCVEVDLLFDHVTWVWHNSVLIKSFSADLQ